MQHGSKERFREGGRRRINVLSQSTQIRRQKVNTKPSLQKTDLVTSNGNPHFTIFVYFNKSRINGPRFRIGYKSYTIFTRTDLQLQAATQIKNLIRHGEGFKLSRGQINAWKGSFGDGLRGAMTGCSQAVPTMALAGSNRQASLRFESVGGGSVAGGQECGGRRRRQASRGLLQEVSVRSPRRKQRRARRGEASPPSRSTPPQAAAHEEGPLLSPPRSPPADLGSAGPAAAGEAWRPGPDASGLVALSLRQPPTRKTFLRPAEPKTNRVRRVPRAARPHTSTLA